MEALQETARAATSKPVQRAVVNTVLFVSGALFLLGPAAIASALFFQNFVPDQKVTRPIHLQYGSSPNPYGIVSLASSSIKTQQDYDVSVSLSMPRSPPNVERGNFMINIALLDLDLDSQLAVSARAYADNHKDFGKHTIIFESRRPTLMPFIDPIISLTHRLLFVFYHLLFPSSHTVHLEVPLAERIRFSGSTGGLPAAAYVELEAGQAIQIYQASITLYAKLSGLRWFMLHYRSPAYLIFTTMFWMCEITFMAVAWLFWDSVKTSPKTRNGARAGTGSRSEIKVEDELRFANEVGSKEDELYADADYPPLDRKPIKLEAPDLDAELPDENPSEIEEGGRKDWKWDSGLGTSYSEEGSEKPAARRRSSNYARD